jgi:hypothetical protein
MGEVMPATTLEDIHDSLVNGQRRQMVEYIDAYGLYDFFRDYWDYLNECYSKPAEKEAFFVDAVVSYHRIKNR